MPNAIDHAELSPIPRKILLGEAPGQAVKMAASGVIMGAPPNEVLTVVAALSLGADEELANTAKQTLAGLPPPLLDAALGSDLQGAVTEVLARILGLQANVAEKLLRMPRLSEEALVCLAKNADEAIGELVATNERLLLLHPKAIESLYMNKRVRMSTADRLLELAVRNKIKLDIPAYDQAVAAIINEPRPEINDDLHRELEEVAEQVESAASAEETHKENEQGEEEVAEKFLPLHAKLGQMSISEKIRRAILGTGAERALLIKDHNKLVAGAAASSPQFTERDAIRVASNRNVNEEVLRIISKNRTFTRGYQIKLALVGNPKTPLPFASGFISHLRESDLKALTKDKNVASNVKTLVRQQLAKKQKKR
jgi:hypothetical protein